MATKRFQRQTLEDACYLTEDSLTQELSLLVTSRKSPVPCREVAAEFDYSSGRADVVGRDRQSLLHAFEAKLTQWRKALDQARRNACFAHYCYVVIPSRSAGPALRAKEEFRRLGVGLVVMTGVDAILAVRPRRNDPLLPWLTKAAMDYLGTNG